MLDVSPIFQVCLNRRSVDEARGKTLSTKRRCYRLLLHSRLDILLFVSPKVVCISRVENSALGPGYKVFVGRRGGNGFVEEFCRDGLSPIAALPCEVVD